MIEYLLSSYSISWIIPFQIFGAFFLIMLLKQFSHQCLRISSNVLNIFLMEMIVLWVLSSKISDFLTAYPKSSFILALKPSQSGIQLTHQPAIIPNFTERSISHKAQWNNF